MAEDEQDWTPWHEIWGEQFYTLAEGRYLEPPDGPKMVSDEQAKELRDWIGEDDDS